MIYLTHARTASTTHVELLDDIKYPQRVNWFPETYAKAKSGLFYPPHLVMKKVLDPDVCKAVSKGRGKTAFIYAAGNTTLASGYNPTHTTRLSYTYKFLPLTLTNIYAGKTAQLFGSIESVQTDSSACASSLKVLTDVQTLIQFYGYDRVVVLAGEDSVSNSTLDFFGETRASLQVGDGRHPSAFDKVNGGFHVGQGAALAVFEVEQVLTAPPIARLMGAGFSGEHCTNPIGQLPSGEGFTKATTTALRMSGLTPADISVVKTHGTGTESNNTAEQNGINALLPKYVATSYKPSIGHTMGASGLLESILLIESLRKGIAPKIAGRTEYDPVYLSEDCAAPDGYMLSLAAGMGNIYAAAAFDWRV